MKKLGIRYDSSIFPVKSPLYGVPDAPKQPYSIDFNNISNPSSKEDIHEFPLSVLTLPLITNNMPIAGGFYFRLFPYYFSKYIFKYLKIYFEK